MARVFMKGTEAIAEAAVRAGCRFFAGYPITPQNEIPEYLARRLPEVGGSFVQGESEVASINMVYGAAGTGTRAMTSSSSCGISLMSEGVSFCASARVPIVYVNVQRGGPGIGTIQPAQQDYAQATKASGNGGFRMRVFSPSTVQEAVDMTYAAFDYAQQDRNPVLILTDGVMGTIMEPVALPPERSAEEVKALKDQCRPWAAVGRRFLQGAAGHCRRRTLGHQGAGAPLQKGRGTVQELAQRGGDAVSGRRRGGRHRLRHLRAYCTLGGKAAAGQGAQGGLHPPENTVPLPCRRVRGAGL